MPSLAFQLITNSDEKSVEVVVNELVIAGWTSRDKDAMETHMLELEAIGIPRPKSAPIFYRVSADQLTQNESITVIGEDSSGEVEFIVLSLSDGLWIGVGSDHTDRKVEAYNVSISKQVCAKPISTTLWRYDDLIGHWGDLILRSYAIDNGNSSLYQEGPVTTMLPAEELIGLYNSETGDLAENTLMFCGTLAVKGGIRSMDAFEIELEDPVAEKKITHHYAIETLPNEG